MEKVKKEQRNKLLQDTAKVKNKDKLTGYTPESEQVLVAELQLLRLLHTQNLWHRAGDAWHTSLLPKGARIQIMAENLYTCVLKTNESAALCWEAERVQVSLWRKSENVP